MMGLTLKHVSPTPVLYSYIEWFFIDFLLPMLDIMEHKNYISSDHCY